MLLIKSFLLYFFYPFYSVKRLTFALYIFFWLCFGKIIIGSLLIYYFLTISSLFGGYSNLNYGFLISSRFNYFFGSLSTALITFLSTISIGLIILSLFPGIILSYIVCRVGVTIFSFSLIIFFE